MVVSVVVIVKWVISCGIGIILPLCLDEAFLMENVNFQGIQNTLPLNTVFGPGSDFL